MTSITIGKDEDGKPVLIDLQKFLETRGLIQANSGGGKSETIRTFVEESYGHVQIIMLDTEGEFSTLREKCPEFLVIGKDADIEINIKMAALLPEKLLTLEVNTIIDMYELQAHEQVLFVKRFVDAMVALPKELWKPVIVILDEIQLYCPQKGNAESSQSIINIAKRGRKRQQALLGATQRISAVNKDMVAECNNKFIGRCFQDIDRKRAAEEIGFSTKEEILSLRDLDPGEFYAFGPAVTKKVTRMRMNRSVTRPPKVGTALANEHVVTPAKIRSLLSSLANLPQEAVQRERSIDELRKENADLRRQITMSKKSMPVDTGEVRALRQQVAALTQGAKKHQEFTQRSIAALQANLDAAKHYEGVLLQIESAIREAKRSGKKTQEAPRENLVKDDAASLLPIAKAIKKEELSQVREERKAAGRIDPSMLDVSKSQMKILVSLAKLELVGYESVSRQMLAGFCEVSSTSGGFFNNLGALRSLEYITYPQSNMVALTSAGRDMAGPVDAPRNDEELQESWRKVFSASQIKIFDALVEIYPDEIGRNELAEKIGVSPTSGGFFNNLGDMRTKGAIEYPEKGMVVASKNVFLERR